MVYFYFRTLKIPISNSLFKKFLSELNNLNEYNQCQNQKILIFKKQKADIAIRLYRQLTNALTIKRAL